jgi:DNA-binding NtrC family response regulator
MLLPSLPPVRSGPKALEWLESVLLGSHASMDELRDRILRYAAADDNVLITAPSGTGKLLVAEALHALSARGDREPITIILADQQQRDMLKSTLDGYEKWSWTGANKSQEGLLLQADGNSVIVDDAQTIPSDVQASLLRRFEQKRFRPIGSSVEQSSDFRIIATTNEPLLGHPHFRQDLYERMAVLTIEIPALREHKEDIPLYAASILLQKARNGRPKLLSAAAMDLLLQHDWPRNYRELQNVLARASALAREDLIEVETVRRALPPETRSASAPKRLPLTKDRIEKALVASAGRKAEAAKALGVCRQGLWTAMRRLRM